MNRALIATMALAIVTLTALLVTIAFHWASQPMCAPAKMTAPKKWRV